MSLCTRSRTNSAADAVEAEPAELVKTARYCLPLSARSVVNERLKLVAPKIFTQLAPPLVLTCHWAVGTGEPVALAEMKIAVPVRTVVVGGGFSVTTGADVG